MSLKEALKSKKQKPYFNKKTIKILKKPKTLAEKIYERNKKNKKKGARKMLQEGYKSKKKRKTLPKMVRLFNKKQEGLPNQRRGKAISLIRNKIWEFIKNSPDFYEKGIETVRLATFDFFVDEEDKTINIIFFDKKLDLFFLSKLNIGYSLQEAHKDKHIHWIILMTKEDYQLETPEEPIYAQIF